MKKIALSLLAILSIAALMACSPAANDKQVADEQEPNKDLSGLHKAYFASGCFWCVEAVFESVEGVEEAVSGYSGGESPNPTYRQVSAGATRHAEAVLVYYDSSVVDYPTLLKVFFGSQDPTTPNRQGPDRGPQYRSIAFYQNAAEKQIIEDYIAELDASGQFDDPIVTEVTPFEKFWEAEDYHQDYERRNPNQPYVRSVSIPRLRRFQKQFPELLKEGHD
jgi:peptide-methionine (S)-S-oxide reductase